MIICDMRDNDSVSVLHILFTSILLISDRMHLSFVCDTFDCHARAEHFMTPKVTRCVALPLTCGTCFKLVVLFKPHAKAVTGVPIFCMNVEKRNGMIGGTGHCIELFPRSYPAH